jgi:hypothetical protein
VLDWGKIFKKCILKRLEINQSSVVNAMERSNALLCKNVKCVGDGEKNKMVQFEALWRKVRRELETGVWSSGSGQV